MLFLSFSELIDLVAMIIFLGLIFWDIFRIPHTSYSAYEPLEEVYLKKRRNNRTFLGIPARDFWNSVMIVAPAIALHEMAHKFLANSFGIQAVFHASYFWLILGLILKLVRFPFLIFVPGYVSIYGSGTPLQNAAVAFAGPAANLLLWLGSLILLKSRIRISSDKRMLLALSARVNMFLFLFNMLPIPPFDGFSVFSNLFVLLKAFF
ncbi:MAG: hypothetical protein QXW00_03280 [Candidatus Woesearchaeota archaeon]